MANAARNELQAAPAQHRPTRLSWRPGNCVADTKKHKADVNDSAGAALAAYCGIAMRDSDELATVRDGFAAKKPTGTLDQLD